VARAARGPLETGLSAYAARRWTDAYDQLVAADELSPLSAGELELLAVSAAMLGRDEEWTQVLERAHHAYVEEGANARAVRCAFWIGVRLARGGELGRATGWLARAGRLLEHEQAECVEHGYLLLPQVFGREAEGDFEGAAELSAAAAEIGRRFQDDDLVALATHERGEILITLGRVREGLTLLDESMVLATEGKLLPYVTGIVYCGTIASCQKVYEVRRAGEWTALLSAWCESQPELLAFTGNCLVHRAEILHVHGSWEQALEEARQARERLLRAENARASAYAQYREGELHRLRGDFASAEEAYLEARRCGYEPQPGLSLLRLAQGRADTAAAAIRRCLAERVEPLERVRLLPAQVEIALAVGDVDEAESACAELERIASGFGTVMLAAMAAHARGAVDLAAAKPRTALVALRRATTGWHEVDAPYEAACARVLVALACRDLDDDEGALLELEAARETFDRLGAVTDIAWVDSYAKGATASDGFGLTGREREILGLVAAGRSNREIAAELVISRHTVARHLQNIFVKLEVGSRTAAAAFAHQHGLL
jgi:DNA-binding CsgD family transcriptional regulator